MIRTLILISVEIPEDLTEEEVISSFQEVAEDAFCMDGYEGSKVISIEIERNI